MSTLLHVLLKAEGDVEDGKAHPSVFLKLGQVSALQYCQGTAGFIDH